LEDDAIMVGFCGFGRRGRFSGTVEARALWPWSVATDIFNEIGRRSLSSQQKPCASLSKPTGLRVMPSLCTFSAQYHILVTLQVAQRGSRIILASRERAVRLFF
jgi:hypothetical protein